MPDTCLAAVTPSHTKAHKPPRFAATTSPLCAAEDTAPRSGDCPNPTGLPSNPGVTPVPTAFNATATYSEDLSWKDTVKGDLFTFFLFRWPN